MSAHQDGRGRRREGRIALGSPWRWLAALVAGTLALAAALVGAPAMAAPVYQIEASWAAGTPTTVKSGDVVTGVWRINVNDDAPAPSNDPVDNVTVTITAQNGRYTAVPSLCLTTGVTPASSISADGHTLVCNVGTRDQGTAVVIQAPIVADGATGDQITADGSIGGQTASLSPIDITNPFGMDIRWGVGTPNFSVGDGGYLVDYEWTLSKALGSEAGPQSITYNLNIASPQGSAVSVDAKACSPFTGPGAADGHPWSGGTHPATQLTVPAGTCTITQTGANTFQMTITGIDYSPANPPTLDSAGNRLPVDQVALASGSIWIRVNTAASGSVVLNSDAPTYTSVTGQTAQDDPSNNAESKAWTTPGLYSSGWGRGYTNSGGTQWDDTYRVSAGTTVGQYMDSGMQLHTDRPDDRIVGMCTALDTRYVTYAGWGWAQPVTDNTIGATAEYYVGNDPTVDPSSAAYDPNAFDCGSTGGWTTVQPTDLTTVKAMRITATQGQFEQLSAQSNVTAVVYQKINANVPAGTDIWSFFSGVVDVPLNNWWNGTGCITPTAGSRYPCTTGFRDVLRVVTATPAVAKSADRSVVSPGDPAVYTLTYSANGAGAIPATVDGYQLVDTLPAGVTYVPGTASPEPAVSTNGSGQQVLTWTLNGVTTNADHALTYQAVADSSVTPGSALVNSVSASYGGITKSATAQVTVATDGYTTVVKTADAPFIPNVNGDGTGTGSWTVTVKSYDPVTQPFTDTIDILPYNGDGRGTAYTGSYALTSVNAPLGATVYYTTADPTTLSDDPSAAQNGAAPGDPTGNTAGWTTTMPANPTAVRVIGGSLAPGATQQFGVHITTNGVKGGDTLVNRAQAIAGHTALVMRTSAAISVANYYSATILKEVQAADGTWHDANSSVDYPAFHYGDTVHYRVTVTNTGQGTLTNVDLTDDKSPTAGAFHIASLAPGASESHEYDLVLDETLPGGGFVNTACATADTPADSGIAPTIPCDPAGIDIAGYSVVKTADPAPGSVVHSGDVIHYTVTVTQRGPVPSAASFTDDLSKVVDDATYNGDVAADAGTATVTGSSIAWTGTLGVGAVAKITYSVTVKDARSMGDGTLDNVVTSDGCAPASDCETVHRFGSYTFAKTSDPASGHAVKTGDRITYTLTIAQFGAAPVTGGNVVDDLSKVLDDATWTGDQRATSGTVTRAGSTLTWTGDLAVGQVVTVTYSVVVTGDGDKQIANVVTSPDGDAFCVPAPDKNPDCATSHRVDDPAVTAGLASTGSTIGWGVGGLAGILFAAGGALLFLRRRRISNT
ncbi:MULTISPECIES: DUF7927 domain-containing protein [unclassified Leifsonia]|uniref:DUF7927 domain-containing protein n=1 Tax=unclassified Leifsonia TaxID=2663824 RepID=UPI000B7D03F2|nr:MULTISPECIES: DUF11 domain-containing protein [unclassified Leifsonia]